MARPDPAIVRDAAHRRDRPIATVVASRHVVESSGDVRDHLASEIPSGGA